MKPSLTRSCRRASPRPGEGLSAGVQNRTAPADIAVKCSKKTASDFTIIAEFLPFGRLGRDETVKTGANVVCFRCNAVIGLMRTETLPGLSEDL
jgi:hypothetical protein